MLCWIYFMVKWFISNGFILCIIGFIWFKYVYYLKVVIYDSYWFYVVKNDDFYVSSIFNFFFMVFIWFSILLVSIEFYFNCIDVNYLLWYGEKRY